MALLDDVVEIFDLTNHDRNILAGIDLSDRRSLLPFMKQMPSLGYLQDFIDKVVAVIEQKKPSPNADCGSGGVSLWVPQEDGNKSASWMEESGRPDVRGRRAPAQN